MSGAGPRHVGQRARGPRLLRHRQPAAGAHRQGRRARPRWQQPAALRLRRRRAHRLVRRGPRRGARRAARPRRAHAGAVPRGVRRRARSAGSTRRAARTRSPTRSDCSRASRRSARSSRSSRAAPTSSSTRRCSTCTSSGTGSSRSSPPTPPPTSLQVDIVSFGFKHGLPLDVDLVFDCRFLPNPHWVDELRPLDGRDAPVRDYVMSQDDAQGVPRRAAATLRADAPGVRARGQGVPVDRARLHRRPAPQRRDGRGARRHPRRPRLPAPHPPPGRRP